MTIHSHCRLLLSLITGLCCLLLGGGVTDCFAEIIRVPDDQPTIMLGINNCAEGDTVLVAPGTYSQQIDFMGKGIKVIGEAGADSTILFRENLSAPLLQFKNGEPSTAQFSGFTVSGGGTSPELVYIDSGATPTISECIFKDYQGGSSQHVMVVYTDAVITRNLFYKNGGDACILIQGEGIPRILNNTFDRNHWGIYSPPNHGILLNNCITNSERFGIIGGFNHDDYNNAWGNNPDYGDITYPATHDISENPLYFNPERSDYRLQYGSPCINAGDPDPAYNDSDGSRNDIGAIFRPPEEPDEIILSAENEANVLRLIDHRPVFQWAYEDSVLNQTAYELEVDSDGDWTIVDMWATGEVISGIPSVQYGANNLHDGERYYVRLRLDRNGSWTQWYERAIQMNIPPAPPNPIYPVNDYTISIASFRLWIDNDPEPDGDLMLCDYEIYGDSLLTDSIIAQYDRYGQTGMVSSDAVVGLEPYRRYWWRARSHDGYEYSEWSETAVFHTRLPGNVHVPLDYPTIQAAIDGASTNDTILMSPGTYTEHIDFKGKNVVVMSIDGPETTIMTGSTVWPPVVWFKSNEGPGAVLTGFTFIGGYRGQVIQTENDARPTITGNIFRDFDGYAPSNSQVIRVYSDAIITRNIFYNNAPTNCITIFDLGTATIENNTFFDNYAGIHNTGNRGTVKNNIFYQWENYAISGAYHEKAYNFYLGHPLFVDTAAHDFRLKPGSPCIDAGDPDPAYNDPDGSRNDIGAIPYNHVYPHLYDLSLGEEDTTHVLSTTPIFSWKYLDTLENQAAYEIEIGTDNDWSVAEMWQPGVVMSSDTSVLYAGLPLEEGQNYVVRVRATNGTIWTDWDYQHFHINAVPTAPQPLFPYDNARMHMNYTWLWVHSSQDAEGDYLDYEFYVYSDSTLETVVALMPRWYNYPDSTRCDFIYWLQPETRYWWRVRSTDRRVWSEWSEVWSFVARPTGKIYVPSEWPTINKAVEVAYKYDTVFVAPGTCSENVDYQSKEITIMGSGIGKTILTPLNPDQPAVACDYREGPKTEFCHFTVTGGTGPILIKVASGDGLHICYNEFYGYREGETSGTVIYVSSPARIDHNVFHHNGGGACIGINSHTEVYNNTLDHNGGGIVSSYGTSKASNNIVTNSGNYGIRGAYAYQDYNTVWNNAVDYSNGAVAGPNSLSTDPLYTDFANFDYTLQAGSPCIDAGDPDPAYNDIDGSRADMGAFARMDGLPLALNLNFGGHDPEHLVDHKPIFHWSYADTGGTQMEYEIEVGSDSDWTAAEMWVSTAVSSSDLSATYDGAELLDGQRYYLRIRVYNGSKWGNWLQYTFRMNSEPLWPWPSYPPQDGIISVHVVHLEVENGVDSEGDSLTYDFVVYDDSGLTNAVVNLQHIPETPTVTKTGRITGLLQDTRYYWRARTHDGLEYSPWSETASFVTRGGMALQVPGEFATIQEAIDVAVNGDTVQVAPGTYAVNFNYFGKNVKVLGAGAEYTTLVPADVDKHMVEFSGPVDTMAEFSGFTITGRCNDYFLDINDYSHPTISHNIFHDCVCPKVISVASRGRGFITRNLFYNNGGESCIGSIEGNYRLRIINNTFDRNNRGISSVYGDGGGYVYNNIITNSTDYGIFGKYNGIDYNCTWSNDPNYDAGASAGPGEINVDPQFVNPTLGNYELKSTSPCIDAGHPDEQYKDPDNTCNDMGAYYYRQPLGTDDEDLPLPLAFALYQNYPNPFNPTTVISFALPKSTEVALDVYNILGQRVIRLADGAYPAGVHKIEWDGCNEQGRRVASGIYIYRLVADSHTAARKMALMK